MDGNSVRGSPRRGLAGATLGFFIGLGVVVLYSPVAEEFRQAMDLSGVLLGLLVGTPSILGSLLRIPFGTWVDDVGAKKPFVILLSLSAIGIGGLSAILLLFYPDDLTIRLYPAILFFGALSGCGIGVFPVGGAQTSYWYPLEKQGTVLAIYGGLGNSAPGVFTILVPIALTVLGLTTTYLVWFVLMLLGTIAYVVIAVDPYYFQFKSLGDSPDRARTRAKERGQELFPTNETTSLHRAVTLSSSWILVALYFVSFGGFLALTVWLPTYWTVFHGLDVRVAGVLTAVGFIFVGTLVRILGGMLSDRVGGERGALLGFGALGGGAVILMITGDVRFATLGMVSLAIGTGIANAAVFQLLPHYVPEAIGGASGLISGIGGLGGFVLPPFLGLFVDVYGMSGYAYGFVLFLILGSVGVVLAVLLPRLAEPTHATS